jgi:glycosyltransferase involved in cell wall biosynthesis
VVEAGEHAGADPGEAAVVGGAIPPAPARGRLAVVGMSVNRYCGVRDHGALLTAELERRGWSCAISWLDREASGLAASRAEVRSWLAALTVRLQEQPPDAVILHYSVFSYCHRGFPIFLRPLLAVLGDRSPATVTIGHELAYPWHHAGLRGKLWALAQRPAVRELVRASAGVLVTADFRADWLRSRWWLPERPVLVAPVFSNLPAARTPAQPRRDTIGVFGYAYGGVAVDAVLDAVRLLAERRTEVQLLLLGSPGADSQAASAWLAGARARGIEARLSFTGALPAQELSDALAGCNVLLFGDAIGPSSRKGTLAGSLQAGRPLVAIDGPRTWPLLRRSGAARVVAPSAPALVQALGELMDDDDQADALGARGREFAEREMGIGRTAEVVESLLLSPGVPARPRRRSAAPGAPTPT